MARGSRHRAAASPVVRGEAVRFECAHVPRLGLKMSRSLRTSLNPVPFLFFLCLPKHAAPHPNWPIPSRITSLLFIYLFRLNLKKKKTGPHYVAHPVLKFIIFLPLPPKCCFYRWETLQPGLTLVYIISRTFYRPMARCMCNLEKDNGCTDC